MKRLLFLLPLTLLLVGCGSSSQVASKSYIAGNGTVTFVEQHDRILGPDLSGRTLDGEIFEIQPNRVVVVNVWASWCAPCRAEAPTLASLATTYKDVIFVGVLTRDSEVAARAFQNRFNLPYPTLIDDSVLLGLRNSLSANAIPSTILIDKKGRVAARISGEITVASLSDLIEKLQTE